jgi:hypothetical protein
LKPFGSEVSFLAKRRRYGVGAAKASRRYEPIARIGTREKPETLEAKVKRQHAELAKAIQQATKPKSLDEMLEEYDLEMAED